MDFTETAAMMISIHAPPRGATKLEFYSAASLYDFNSRPSARGDHQLIS